jgi:predicted membrane protein
VVRFSQPNAARCGRATISAGAAEVSVLGLGNSRCDEIEFEGGVGSVTLDFGGAWSSSSRVKVTMAMGALTLRLPRNAGVRISMEKFLSSFQPHGLLRQGDAFVSENYDKASRRLDLNITSAVGDVTIEWLN